MLKLAVIADDFTGALDTGIKFAKKGIATQVVLWKHFSFSHIPDDCSVLAVDAETRHLKPEEAYRVVYGITKCFVENEVEYIFKKTDSALRGCVGSELAALADAAGCHVEFIPALPEERRTTVDGIQYISGVPVSESVFGRDPFEPVRHSGISDIIHEQTDKEVVLVKKGDQRGESTPPGIAVYDAVTDEDIREIVTRLLADRRLRVMAGCSGLASSVSKLLDFPKNEVKRPHRTRSLFVVCGSVNDIALRQVQYAQNTGFHRITLNSRQKLDTAYFESEEGKTFIYEFEKACRRNTPVIIDGISKNTVEETAHYAKSIGLNREDLRARISKCFGEFVVRWLKFRLQDTLFITGGDTVYAFLSLVKCAAIEPVCEVAPGVVLFNVKTEGREVQVVSKSGGFGDERIFVEIASKMTAYGGVWDEKGL